VEKARNLLNKHNSRTCINDNSRLEVTQEDSVIKLLILFKVEKIRIVRKLKQLIKSGRRSEKMKTAALILFWLKNLIIFINSLMHLLLMRKRQLKRKLLAISSKETKKKILTITSTLKICLSLCIITRKMMWSLRDSTCFSNPSRNYLRKIEWIDIYYYWCSFILFFYKIFVLFNLWSCLSCDVK